MSQWFEIGGPGTSFTTYDGVVKGKINKTTFTAAATNADIPYTESTVTYDPRLLQREDSVQVRVYSRW